MANIFITNLGKARKLDGGRYRVATYLFDDKTEIESNMFGFALLKWLKGKKQTFDKVVILGTATSMWDALLEGCDDNLSDDDIDFYSQLGKKVDSNCISITDLQKLSALLSKIYGINFICKQIPYGLNNEEQQTILSCISEEIPQKSNVVFDFTHGLRHLPFFALLSVFHLKTCNNSRVNKIYYGALELSSEHNGKTPVISMDFALSVMDWLKALTVSENRGNFKVIAEMPNVSEKLSKNLENLSFMRMTNQVNEMKKYAEQSLTELKSQTALPVAGELYQEHIIERLEALNEKSFAMRQLKVAEQALEKQNYLQAVSLALEAFISARISKDPLNYEKRETAKEQLHKAKNKTYGVLNKLRNALIHGTRPQGGVHYKDRGKDSPVTNVLRMLKDEELLRTEMQQFIDNIRQSIIAKKGA